MLHNVYDHEVPKCYRQTAKRIDSMRIIAIHHLLARSYKTTFVLFWIYRPVDGWKHASGYTKFPPLKPFWGQISEVDGFSLHLCF